MGLTDQISVGRAGPLLKFDAAAGQVLPKLHPPLWWQVLHGVLLTHVGVADPEREGVSRHREREAVVLGVSLPLKPRLRGLRTVLADSVY